MATYRQYSVDNVDDVKQYGDFDAYFKCKDMDINFDEYVKPRIMRAIDLSDKDLSGINSLFTNMCAVVDYYRLMQDSAMFHDWQRRLDESSRKVLNLLSEPEDESEKEF